MVSGSQVVEKAREYIGTKWTHKGRIKGVGVDCVGLLVGVFAELGIEVDDDLDYSSGDEFARLNERLARHGFATDRYPEMGDVVVFRNTRSPGSQAMLNHVGIVTDVDSFVHAWATPSAMRVVETPFDDFWRSHIAAVYLIA